MGDVIPTPVRLPPLLALNSKPLEGVRVLEFTRIIAGPVGGRLLAELGATVVRVLDKSLPDFGMFQVSNHTFPNSRACPDVEWISLITISTSAPSLLMPAHQRGKPNSTISWKRPIFSYKVHAPCCPASKQPIN